ncbi:MAG: GNAT family protein [Acidobacteriota bacterium]
MSHAFLTGKVVALRAIERADAPVILPWVNDQRVIEQLLIHRPTSLAAEEAFIDSLSRSDHDVVFGVAELESGRLVGVCGLHRIDTKNRHAEFGIFIGESDARGKGLGSEATALIIRYGFDTLNLHRVWLRVYEDNKPALKAYEKVGFRREGLLRQDSFRRGRYWNTIVMGLLRADWKKAAARGRRG